MKIRTVTKNFDEKTLDELPDKEYYVTMTDTFLSDWGQAKGKTNKVVIGTNNYSRAKELERKARERSDMKYVNIATNKPRYDDDVIVSYRDESQMNW